MPARRHGGQSATSGQATFPSCTTRTAYHRHQRSTSRCANVRLNALIWSSYSNPRMEQKPLTKTDRYEALVSTGEYLFIDGYEAAQPKLIAGLAGVSVGLFYKHFRDKRELLAEIMVRHLDRMHTEIGESLEGASDPKRQLQLLVEITLRYFQEQEGVIRLFFMEIGYGDAGAAAKLRRPRENYRRMLRDIVIAHNEVRGGRARPEADYDAFINCVIGTINWTLFDVLIAKGDSLDAKSVARRLLRLFNTLLDNP
jgi:AcrR family transcriptional regulator